MRILLPLLMLLLIPQQVFADVHVSVSSSGSSSVSVNSETNGESTVCVNGDCKTTGGGGKSTACVDGKCYDSDSNGNLDVNENNGNTQVHVNSAGSDNNVIINNTTGAPENDVGPTGIKKDEAKNSTESGSAQHDNSKNTKVETHESIINRLIEKMIDLVRRLFPDIR
ncbi:MAG TPA: hypothetical protein VG965_00915 [Patescibacteria group bacterium]|nr:hypothetical protein [Patescibacteria group bacterium]